MTLTNCFLSSLSKETIIKFSDDTAFRKPRSYELLGEIYRGQKKYQKAEANYQKALTLADKTITVSNLPDYARKLVSLAKINEETGTLDKAIEFYQKALNVLAPEFENLNPNENPSSDILFSKLDALDILESKGSIFWKKYQTTPEEAFLKSSYNSYKSGTVIMKDIRQGVVTQEAKNILSEKMMSIYEGAIRSVLALYEMTHDETLLHEAFLLAESNKSLLLLKSINEQAAFGMIGLPDCLIQREKQLRLEIAFYQKQLMEASQKNDADKVSIIQKWKGEIFKLKGELTQLTDFFEDQYPRFYNQKYRTEIATVAACQQYLNDQHQGMVEYFVGEENIYGFVIWKDGVDVFQVENDGEIMSMIEKLRTAIRQVPDDNKILENYQSFVSTAFFL